jgi:hypothetical protein
MYMCHDCNKLIQLDAIRFCPYCSSQNIKTFHLGKAIPQDKVVLIIKKTDSKTVQGAVTLMKSQLGYFELGTQSTKYCCAAYDACHALDAAEILQTFYPRLNYLLYEKGVKRTSPFFLLEPYRCVSNRNTSQFNGGYCYGLDSQPNIVGCRHMGLELPTYAWLHFAGYYEDPFGNYIYDKSYLLKKIEIIEKRYQYCPYMDASTARRFVDAWPDRINIFLDKRFRQVPKDYFDFPRISIPDVFRNIYGFKKDEELIGNNIKSILMPPLPVDYSFYKDLLYKVFPDQSHNAINIFAERAISSVLETVKSLK